MKLIKPSKKFWGMQGIAPYYKAAAAPSLALDGNAVDSSPTTSSLAPVLTTTQPNTVVLVLIAAQASGVSISSVSGGTLGAFTLRTSANRFSSQKCWVYYKVASGVLTSETITVTFSGATGDATANAVAISGANTASPFDPNGALPGLVGTGGAGGAYAEVTTTNANTFLYAVSFSGGVASPTQGAGWTLLQAPASRAALMEYKIVAATQTATQATSGNAAAADIDCAIADAVTA